MKTVKDFFWGSMEGLTVVILIAAAYMFFMLTLELVIGFGDEYVRNEVVRLVLPLAYFVGAIIGGCNRVVANKESWFANR